MTNGDRNPKPAARVIFFIGVFVVLFLSRHSSFVLSASADEKDASKKTGARLQFLPPPMEGTISLGVYDARGRLVRTLHRESEKDALTKESDGLVATWDGKDDLGNEAPAGKYRARGFVVGEIKINGEAFHFNDWITGEDSPRVRRIGGVAVAGEHELVFRATASGGGALTFLYDFEKDETRNIESEKETVYSALNYDSKLDVALKNDVKLAITIDGDAQSQTTRGLFSTSILPAFEKRIVFSDEFGQVKGRLEIAKGKPFIAAEKISVTLRPNPLERDRAATIEVSAGFDKDGSFLKTADGLVLRAISETKNLRWVALGRAADGKSLAIFQSDGAVVEQFTVGNLRDMMPFDCGVFELDRAKTK